MRAHRFAELVVIAVSGKGTGASWNGEKSSVRRGWGGYVERAGREDKNGRAIEMQARTDKFIWTEINSEAGRKRECQAQLGSWHWIRPSGVTIKKANGGEQTLVTRVCREARRSKAKRVRQAVGSSVMPAALAPIHTRPYSYSVPITYGQTHRLT
ncbi:unnamed protein product [Protopolystoma xenopodis]|uniref:Uncharacterized protein n=1 Tax=Protopolystoma xenopodis TaxID=117903 RepID=A0A3S4ZVI9_9PLAT|nr:unnamed protein product [Protopolystoma xenopodis]